MFLEEKLSLGSAELCGVQLLFVSQRLLDFLKRSIKCSVFRMLGVIRIKDKATSGLFYSMGAGNAKLTSQRLASGVLGKS